MRPILLLVYRDLTRAVCWRAYIGYPGWSWQQICDKYQSHSGTRHGSVQGGRRATSVVLGGNTSLGTAQGRPQHFHIREALPYRSKSLKISKPSIEGSKVSTGRRTSVPWSSTVLSLRMWLRMPTQMRSIRSHRGAPTWGEHC